MRRSDGCRPSSIDPLTLSRYRSTICTDVPVLVTTNTRSPLGVAASSSTGSSNATLAVRCMLRVRTPVSSRSVARKSRSPTCVRSARSTRGSTTESATRVLGGRTFHTTEPPPRSPSTSSDASGCGKTARAATGGFHFHVPLLAKRSTTPSAVIP